MSSTFSPRQDPAALAAQRQARRRAQKAKKKPARPPAPPPPVVDVWYTLRPPGWTLEAPNAAVLEAVVGRKLLCAFARCAVHVDRMMSLVDFIRMAIDRDRGRGRTVALDRNLATVSWMGAGTLHELVDALDQLRAAVIGAGLLGTLEDRFKTVQQAITTLQRDELLTTIRNRGAHHVDDRMVKRGLKRLAARGIPVVLLQGDDRTSTRVSMRFGPELLARGIRDEPMQDLRHLSNFVAESMVPLCSVLHSLLLAALAAKGVRLLGIPAEWSE